jgi:3-oxoacyl-[acyl-carrier protein] reductase
LDEFCSDDDCGTDKFAGAGNLHIECRLQKKGCGETKVVQSSSTLNLVFSTPQIISYLSKFMTLQPGDVIATGTPPGVGCFRKPEPLWLEGGDIVECEIEGIGVLRNTVVERIDDNCNSKMEETKNTSVASSDGEKQVSATKGPPSNSLAPGSEQLPQQQRLKNTVCIVTGGGRGIGNGIARRLALEGAVTVVLIDMNQKELDKAAYELEQEVAELMGNKDHATSQPIFYGLSCDVTNGQKFKDTINYVARALSPNGRIDILVQAAGVVGKTNVLTHQVEEENFDFVMEVNVKGIFNGCQAVLPYMLEQNYGRIINIASIAGKEGNAGMLAYSTSKAAVIGLTKTIGKEYALNGITCNAIAPAVIRTKMVADMPEQQVKYMTDKIPMQRCGKVEEVAALVAFVASTEAAFTTGFCFDATGGRSTY